MSGVVRRCPLPRVGLWWRDLVYVVWCCRVAIVLLLCCYCVRCGVGVVGGGAVAVAVVVAVGRGGGGGVIVGCAVRLLRCQCCVVVLLLLLRPLPVVGPWHCLVVSVFQDLSLRCFVARAFVLPR